MESKYPSVVVLGAHGCGAAQIRVHTLPVPGESVEGWGYKILKDGGKASHKAMILSKYGVPTAFIGKLGTDSRSDTGVSWLIEHNVNIKHLIRSDNYRDEISVSFMLLDDNGNNMIISTGNIKEPLTFSEAQVGIDDFKDADFFITDLEIAPEVAISGLKLAKKYGMYTILNPSPVPFEPLGILDYVDMICPNETEAKQMLGLDTAKEFSPLYLCEQLASVYKVPQIVITLGDKGAIYWDKNTHCTLDSIKIKAVDPSGAGDDFISSFIFAYFFRKFDIPNAMNWANHAAALSVSRPGSIESFPSTEEVDESVSKDNIQDYIL